VASTVCEELSSAAASILGERKAAIVSSLLGWDGGSPKLLREVGLRFNLTRERVRQIRNHSLKVLSEVGPSLPRTAAAVSLLAEAGPLPLKAASELLERRGLCGKGADPSGLCDASSIALPGTKLDLAMIGGLAFMGTPASLVAADSVSAMARREARRNGFADVQALLRGGASRFFDAERVKVMVGAQMKVVASANGRWLAFPEMRSSRLHLRLDKMLSIADRFGLDEFRHKALSEPRMSDMRLTAEAATFWLSETGCGKVSGNSFVAFPDRRPRREDVLSEAELRMVEVLSSDDEILTIERFEERCLAAGMNRNTFRLYLSWSPVFKRLAKGTYTLLGRAPTQVAERVLAMRGGRRHRSLLDQRWLDDGTFVAVYSATPSSLANGVLPLPKELRGRCVGALSCVCSDASGELETVTGPKAYDKTLTGFRRVFRALSIESGGVLEVSFVPGSTVLRVRASEHPV
jgi:hypothetical protein